MEKKRCFVFRINYDDAHEFVIDELFKGTLRQGWGVIDLELVDSDGKTVDRNKWVANYLNAWDEPVEEIEASNRYWILLRMLELKKGDIVIIPKTRNWQTLTICTVNKEYWFDKETATMWSDFRHCIGVENQRTYSYDSCSEAKLISSKFIAYQSAVNNVRAEKFIENVKELYKREDNFKSATIRQLLLQIKQKSIDKITPDILGLNPSYFEDVVAECLKIKGYVITAMRKYDGEGADADIVAVLPLPFFSIFIDTSPTILIQVKKKSGIDRDDRAGIEQLIKAKKHFENPICILINTADRISEETEKYALQENIKIIGGNHVMELLLTSDLTQSKSIE